MLYEKPKWEELLETNGTDVLVSISGKNTIYFKAKTLGTKDKVLLENGNEFNMNEFLSVLEDVEYNGYVQIDELH